MMILCIVCNVNIDIIKEVNKKTLDEQSTTIFTEYDKWKIGYMRKTDNIVLNVIRGMAKDNGLKFIVKRKGISLGNNQVKMSFLYSIVK